ncbi:MAG: hypothetical protein RI572_13310 [Salegentibacter sp.]|uniref:hypothetical protein n=1 Tax=Salegentibacter sp. TaxID=1903072 RepID=UPI00286FFCEA|nr:hypothetical protein [Salegentibacter sp.]MDR9458377.1 hypothetical protein [Salegentibacter sp.]
MKRFLLTYLLLFTLTIYAQEKEEKLFLTGYIKNLHEFSFVDRLEQLQWTTLLHNRLNFKYIPSNSLTARLEVRNRVFYGDNVQNIPGFSGYISQDNGIADLSWNIIDNRDLLFNSTIDRALINYTNGDWDITVGRQRVNWGMNLIWNPNDIFNTYNFLDFDYEERPGSDAIRVQYYTGDFSKIEVAAKKGKSADDKIIAAMYKFNKASYDIQLITGVYKKDWVIGAGWAGNLKEAGFKGEISYFVPYEGYLDSENVLSSSVSVDYGFKEGLYIYGSVLYNSSAESSSGNVENLLYTSLSAKNLMPFKYSGFLQLANEFTPIFRWAFSSIYSPTRHSVIIIPSLDYSVATNWDLNFTGQSFFEFEDYQTLGNILFVRLRWSF